MVRRLWLLAMSLRYTIEVWSGGRSTKVEDSNNELTEATVPLTIKDVNEVMLYYPSSTVEDPFNLFPAD
jgi:hypothetical protein